MATKSPRIALIIAEYHKDIAATMEKAALAEAVQHGASVVQRIRVPGSYEIPLVAQTLLVKKTVDAVVVLAYIEKGETLHGEVMGHVVHSALVGLQLQYRKPVGLGIIGPGATKAQAVTRAVGAATGAVRAAVKNFHILQNLS